MPSPFARRLGGLVLLALLAPAQAAEPEPDPIYDGKRLSAWLELLQSKDERERRGARQALTSLVKQGRTSVGPLVEALLEVPGDRQVPPARLEMLVQLGPAAVPRLTAALWEEDPTRRALAVFALGQLGRAARPAVPPLLERLKDEDALMRCIIAQALARIRARSAIPALTERLGDKDQRVREAAAQALIHLRVESEVLVPTLLRWLTAGPTAQRRLAALALGALGPEAASAVPALVKVLDDEDGAIRDAALVALASIGPSARDAVGPLRALLKDEERAGNHLAAAEALWLIAGHADAPASLEVRLKGMPGPEKIEAARRLWRYTRNPGAVSALAEMVARGSPPARRGALPVLREIGPGAKAALPAVLPLLNDEDRDLRLNAIAFVGRLGGYGKAAVPALEKLLDGEDRDGQWWAAWALWQVQKDRRTVPPLVKRLRDKDVAVRTAAALLLKQIGPAAQGAVSDLREALKDKDARLRLAASTALWEVDQHPDALPALVRLLRDCDPSVRNDVAAQLGAGLGAKALPAVPALIQAA
jgi:HEAT repeat protein